MLHALEHKGYLTSRIERDGRARRRLYQATAYGIEALARARESSASWCAKLRRIPMPPNPRSLESRHDELE